MAGRGKKSSREVDTFRIGSEPTCRLVGRTGQHGKEGGTSTQGTSGGVDGILGVGRATSVMGKAERTAHRRSTFVVENH